MSAVAWIGAVTGCIGVVLGGVSLWYARNRDITAREALNLERSKTHAARAAVFVLTHGPEPHAGPNGDVSLFAIFQNLGPEKATVVTALARVGFFKLVASTPTQAVVPVDHKAVFEFPANDQLLAAPCSGEVVLKWRDGNGEHSESFEWSV